MRENNILKSLLKYICITISASFVFVGAAKADFDLDTFVSGITAITGEWGDIKCYYEDNVLTVIDYSTNISHTWSSSDNISQLSSQNEWAVKKNGYGTIYGVSECSNDGDDGMGYYDSGQIIKSDEITSNGGNCWCKLTDVAGTDGAIHTLTNTSWVYVVGWGSCTSNGCTEFCARTVHDYSAIRSGLLDGATVVSPIKIATTKYVESKFASSVSELNNTMGTIKNVVDNTIIQADRIGKLHTGKQTRPSDTCPDGAECLLITEADGSLHWYPICNADGTVGTGGSSSSFDVSAFLSQLTSNGNDYYNHGNTTTYNALGYTGSARTKQPSTDSIVRQLNETEWAALWNNTGVVYGTSVCNGNSGTNGVASTTTQTETKGRYCWCKMTSVGDTDKNEYSASGALWVFGNDSEFADDCANYCAGVCASYVMISVDFRGAFLGTSN